MRLIVWGCGERCNYFISNGYMDVNDIVVFVDNSNELQEYYGRKVIQPNQILTFEEKYDYIFVTTKEKSITKQILNEIGVLEIDLNKVILAYNYFPSLVISSLLPQNDYVIKQISNDLFEEIVVKEKNKIQAYQVMYKCSKDNKDAKSVLSTMKGEKYKEDYFRYRTFELLANELENSGVEGCIAELGVFKGVFAQLINKRMPSRDFYLYDSFEGFSVSEYNCDSIYENNGKSSRDMLMDTFIYTSEEKVRSSMPHKSHCVIRKGFFPESLHKEDYSLRFAFVSLDVDLEIPTYEGLKFFYPRLSEGGYIMVHDYNGGLWEGVRSAVNRYETELGIKLKKVPIPDQCGTLIITK